MKLKHLLFLIWIVAYRSYPPISEFVWFSDYKSYDFMMRSAENLNEASSGCPFYVISLDTETLTTEKFYFDPPFCPDKPGGRKLVKVKL